MKKIEILKETLLKKIIKFKKKINKFKEKILDKIYDIKNSIKKYFVLKERLIKENCELQVKVHELEDYKAISNQLAIDKIKLNALVQTQKSENRKLKLELKQSEKMQGDTK